MRRFLISCALLLFAALAASPAEADPVDDILAGFASSKYDEIEKAIAALAASGDASAPAILDALNEGALQVASDKQLYIKGDDGSPKAARSGADLTGEMPPGLKPVKVNNRVRRAIEAAMGQLTLLSPDPAKRLNAAASLFHAPDPAQLPAVEAAIAKETDPAVKRAFEAARAAVVLAAPDAAEADKIAAVELIAARGDEDAKSLLDAAAANGAPAVAAAANAALKGIEQTLALWSAAQNVYYGLSLGSVLLLAAIGLAITFGVMGVINMAHGEMVMLGAYTTYVVQQAVMAMAPGLSDLALLIAVPTAFLVSGAAGIAIERSIIRFLYGRPLETLLATFGLSLVLQQAMRSIFGPTNLQVDNPSWMSGSMQLGGLAITYNRFWIILFSVAIFALLTLVLRKTALGLQMRAVTQNRRMAASMGIRTGWVDSLTFGLGSGVAGIAGVALSQIDNVSPNLGQGHIIDSFMVVVFGGVGNLWGTLVGALSLGVANKLLEPMAGAVLGKIVVLVLLVLFIQRRPRGLFPVKGRAVES
ncbi:urea ABC transporter permease subunit UrtB [Dongia sp.]|uniref:urea ABC transporter permease subunit UrtB n=1 Tax=Dongia sp. TaxID=1977262 RepID=UPI0037538449